MLIEACKRGLIGLGVSSIIIFILLTAAVNKNVDVAVIDVWFHMLGSLIAGAYFGMASLIFDIDRWSPLKQTTIHFCVSIIVYFPIALIVGWIPSTIPAVLIGLLLFSIIYVLHWFVLRWYFSKLAASLNASIRK